MDSNLCLNLSNSYLVPFFVFLSLSVHSLSCTSAFLFIFLPRAVYLSFASLLPVCPFPHLCMLCYFFDFTLFHYVFPPLFDSLFRTACPSAGLFVLASLRYIDAVINLLGRAVGHAWQWICGNMLCTNAVDLGSIRLAGDIIFLCMCLLT